MKIRYENLLYSFDIGTNSIGWCIFALDEKGTPVRIVDAGTRIYSDGRDPQSKTSLAVARRDARSMSRGRDRTLRRRKATLRVLTAHEGGSEHCQEDNRQVGANIVADWLADNL